MEGLGLRSSRSGLWTVRLLLGLVLGLLIAGAELLVAFGLLGVEHEASTAQVYLFLKLATTAAVSVTMLFAVAFRPAGIAISAVLNVNLGLVSSGGLAPLRLSHPSTRRTPTGCPCATLSTGSAPCSSTTAPSMQHAWKAVGEIPCGSSVGREIRGCRPRGCRVDDRRVPGGCSRARVPDLVVA
jgi:hypothetical protein